MSYYTGLYGEIPMAEETWNIVSVMEINGGETVEEFLAGESGDKPEYNTNSHSVSISFYCGHYDSDDMDLVLDILCKAMDPDSPTIHLGWRDQEESSSAYIFMGHGWNLYDSFRPPPRPGILTIAQRINAKAERLSKIVIATVPDRPLDTIDNGMIRQS